MATAPTLPFVTVEEYLRTNYEPHCEYLDGVLAPKAMPDYIHSTLQMLLITFFASQKHKFRSLKGLPELHARITSTRFRIPDISGVTHAETPPLFTIEIVSLEETWQELRGKVTDHLAMGVSTVMIADPYNKTVMVATQSKRLHEIAPPLIVNIEVPGEGVLQIDFDHLYSKL